MMYLYLDQIINRFWKNNYNLIIKQYINIFTIDSFFLWTSIFLLFSYWTIWEKEGQKTNIKKNKQKEIRNRKGKRNLDRIGQKLRNIKGIKLRMGNIETKNDENKRIKMKMTR